MSSLYVMEVCSTCGRFAAWPFCEHHQHDTTWSEPIVVRPVTKRGRALAAMWADTHRPKSSS